MGKALSVFMPLFHHPIVLCQNKLPFLPSVWDSLDW